MPILFKAKKPAPFSKTIYLYGTAHLSDEKIHTLSPQAKAAFIKAPQVGLETIPKEKIKNNNNSNPEFTVEVDSKLTSELEKIYCLHYQGTPPAPQILEGLYHIVLHPSSWKLEQDQKNNHLKSLDWRMEQCARGKLIGLETSNITLANYEEYKYKGYFHSSELTKADAQKAFDYLIQLYKEENLDLLRKIYQPETEWVERYLKGRLFKHKDYDYLDNLSEIPIDIRYVLKKWFQYEHKVFIADRDQEMAQTIDEQTINNAFYAFGALHLLGVIGALENKGYEVIPVLEEPRKYILSPFWRRHFKLFLLLGIGTIISLFAAIGFGVAFFFAQGIFLGIQLSSLLGGLSLGFSGLSLILGSIFLKGVYSLNQEIPPENVLEMQEIIFTLEELQKILQERDDIKQTLNIKPEEIYNKGKYWKPVKKFEIKGNDTAQTFNTAEIKSLNLTEQNKHKSVSCLFFSKKAQELQDLKNARTQEEKTDIVKDYLTMKYRLA